MNGMGLFDWFFGSDNSKTKRNKRVFISFAMEDSEYRDFLVGQARNDRSPFDFVDMSVKKPWNENEWKRRCRSKIKGCDCMIVLLSKSIWNSSRAGWEMRCAKEERIKLVGMHIKKSDKGAIPPELKGCRIIEWSWGNLKKVLQ